MSWKLVFKKSEIPLRIPKLLGVAWSISWDPRGVCTKHYLGLFCKNIERKEGKLKEFGVRGSEHNWPCIAEYSESHEIVPDSGWNKSSCWIDCIMNTLGIALPIEETGREQATLCKNKLNYCGRVCVVWIKWLSLLLLQVFSQWPTQDPTPMDLSSSFAQPKLTGKHSGRCTHWFFVTRLS